MITIDDVIAMKKIKCLPFKNKYVWLILNVENELVSKSNAKERLCQLFINYDYSAKLFIVHQFVHLGKDNLSNELFSILELDSKNTFLEDKYIEELVDEIDL